MARLSSSRLEFLSINPVPQCRKRLLSSNELGRSEAEPTQPTLTVTQGSATGTPQDPEKPTGLRSHYSHILEGWLLKLTRRDWVWKALSRE